MSLSQLGSCMQDVCRSWTIMLLGLALVTSPVLGQDNNNNNNNNGDNNNTTQPAGIEVDAAGVLRVRVNNNMVGVARQQAAKAAMHPDLTKPSKLRKVSLNRLEKVIADRIAKGEKVTADMSFLAGLTAIEYVFYYPESGDIVIAGPAEPFAEAPSGHVVGLQSGMPVLALEDLIVALRCFPPSGEKTKVIGVSIDPTKEGLERMNKFLQSLSGRNITPADASSIAMGLKQNLGLQTVSIRGVAPTSNFARVMVEADYRMKLIGIGLERTAVGIKSFTERSVGKSKNLQRWFFVPDYTGIEVSEDGHAMFLNGPGVKLVGAEELVSSDGTREAKENVNKASQQFTQEFTQKYGKLAQTTPVYAQLKSLIDMSVVAAFIQDAEFYGQSNWNLGVFADESVVSVEKYSAPQHVEPAVNTFFNNGRLLTPIGGGVNIQPRQAFQGDRKKIDESGKLKGAQEATNIQGLTENQWWWD
jgi:hypothetical protein